MGRSGSRRAVGLPAEVTSFVGRQHEIAEAKRLLSVGRLLTLTGAGGVGKTRLAVRVAGQLSRAFPDGVWLVPLAALSGDVIVPHAVADVLGIRDETGGETLDVLVEHLRERRLLLVLDNCEHVLDACARLVGTVLSQAPSVRVLATSRHRLGLAGEHLLNVSPLRVPTPEELARRVAAAKPFPALELFADRAASVVVGFEITAENHKAVARLCRRLDGLPLAIELAAVRLRSLGIEQLVERLDDRYRLLTSGSRSALPRHQTLRAAVDWSYDLCTPQEQRVWAMLSVFAGSFDLSAAEAVCAGEGAGTADILDAVTGLVDKSVLLREADDITVRRYRLLASLRDYGLDKLGELGEVTDVRRRHSDHYTRLAEECEKQWFGPRQPEIVDRLRAERDNFRAAMDFCLTTPGEVQHGLHLVGTLWCYWAPNGAWGEARYWLNQAMRAGAKPSGARAKVHWVGGAMVLIQGRSTAVLMAGAPPGRPATSSAEHVPVATPVADYLPERQHDKGELMSFVVLGRVELACTLVFLGRPERAVPLCAEALAICEAHGEQWARSYVLRTLAMARWTMGEYDSATAHARACLRLKYVMHERQGLGSTLDLLAAIAASAGEFERAAVLQGASGQIWHDIGRNPLESRQQQQAGRIRASERQARKALGDRGFEQAFRRGSQFAPDEAVAYALRDRPEVAGQGAPRPKAPSTADAPSGELTPREKQVAELIAQGLTDKQIADTLVIAQRTAEGHVQHVLVKLGFTSRTQVAAWISSEQPPDGRPEPQ